MADLFFVKPSIALPDARVRLDTSVLSLPSPMRGSNRRRSILTAHFAIMAQMGFDVHHLLYFAIRLLCVVLETFACGSSPPQNSVPDAS